MREFGDVRVPLKAGKVWGELKALLGARGLQSELQAEIRAVSESFAPRNRAAHAVVLPVGFPGAGTVQLLRIIHEKDGDRIRTVSVEQLEGDVAALREAYSAIQAIGRALDAESPAVLVAAGTIRRVVLLGTL